MGRAGELVARGRGLALRAPAARIAVRFYVNDAGTFGCRRAGCRRVHGGARPLGASLAELITIPLAALLACALVSSLAAPEFRGNALRFTGRCAAAILLFTLAANGAVSNRLARQVVAVLLGAAAVVGAIAILELAQVPAVLDGLKVFRPGFHVVGGQLRATSTLFYPTITSIFTSRWCLPSA